LKALKTSKLAHHGPDRRRVGQLTSAVTDPRSLAARASGTLYIAGMRGIDPETNQPVAGEEARIRHAFRNMVHIAEAADARPQDGLRLVVYVTDMCR